MKQHDKFRRDVVYDVGDWDWLWLHHRIASAIKDGSSKLSPRYYGPFQVLERIGMVTYCLQLPARACIHNVFHVALLKKFEGTPSDIVSLPYFLHGCVVPAPSRIVRACLNRGIWELLAQWMGCAAADVTWEKLTFFKDRYPIFQLEDELFHNEGGSVVDAFVGQTYQRRRRATVSNSKATMAA